MKLAHPFHIGEIQMQETLDDRGTAILNGRLIEDSVMPAAHAFLRQLPFIVLSASDQHNNIPVTLVYGEPGFISIDASGRKVSISIADDGRQHQDPVLRILKRNTRVGALAIDLGTRRRLRINGRIASINPSTLTINVDEAFPNCPKYIQKRVMESATTAVCKEYRIESGTKPRAFHYALMRATDTFFVSSLNPNGHADASHRGGHRGFIHILDNGDLRIPDYPGNRMYTTFGNFKMNPYAGMVIWDFDHAALLHLSGSVTFDFSGIDEHNETGGTGRWWIFTPQSWVWQQGGIPFRFRLQEMSPFLPASEKPAAQGDA